MGDVGYDFAADDRARRREERRRRRAEEKAREERERATFEVGRVASFRSSRSSEPEVEVKLNNDQSSEEDSSGGSAKSKLLKKTPTRMSRESWEDKQEFSEVELRLEAIRLKREQENEERYRERLEERRLAKERSELQRQELEERRERRRLKQEAEERRQQQEEEERRAREAEEARKLREEIQKRRQEAEERRRNIQNSLSYIRPKYNISDSILQAERERSMTPEEQAELKARTLEEQVPPLDISAFTSAERLRELAMDLQAKLRKLYAAKFDLMKRKQRQEYDLTELNTRIGDLTKAPPLKKTYVTTFKFGLVSKIKEKGVFAEDKPLRKTFPQERNEGKVAGSGMQDRLNMFQNKTDHSEDQPDIKRSGRSTWKAPAHDKCCICDKSVYTLERLEVAKKIYHKQCFKCQYCKKITSLSEYAVFEGKIYCKPHQLKVEQESLRHGVTPRH
ncbi:vicilin-like seed storage protein At2g18540 isoform X2 [Acanthaster planci]|uniref:Vicilin-like seed storage protein At2g18540 isoform X2 n=1 Tax=Acanthaster planci TaxID=133434 RepID=A0A8B7Y560_ACAPL|nr:vicilin-like seed storage protein At2g18540 isoform X2 [Acanthaster planci]